MEQRSYTVWLDEAARVASFHDVDGYRRHTFTNHSFFLGFLHALQERALLHKN